MSRVRTSGGPAMGAPASPGWNWWLPYVTIAIALAAIVSAVWLSLAQSGAPQGSGANYTRVTAQPALYPQGVRDAAHPSGRGLPAAAFKGYRLTLREDFTGSTLPAGWDVFDGVPTGSPGAHFNHRHVVISGGLLRLNTWRDPAFQNAWVTGGVCQCGFHQLYGAYFVRSRITGGGANEVQLLWPANDRWPPEVDFNESGGYVEGTTATIHYGATNLTQQFHLSVNMRHWHTWGIVWSARRIDYVVDGRTWASITVPSEIPDVAMRLDLEQRTMCVYHAQCPAHPVSMLVDWVAVYSPR